MIRCDECGRRFDLADPADADEWHYGHDCEPWEEAAAQAKSWTEAYRQERERAVPCQHLGCRATTWRNDAICEIHADKEE